MTAFSADRAPDPCVLVIFGATGDLARRKLLPAIWHLRQQGRLPDCFALIGVARTDLDSNEFRQRVEEALIEFVSSDLDDQRLRAFLGAIEYVAGDPRDPQT